MLLLLTIEGSISIAHPKVNLWHQNVTKSFTSRLDYVTHENMQISSSPPIFRPFAPTPMPIAFYVWKLGTGTRLDPRTGNLLKNTALIESLVKHREKVLQPLAQLLNQSMHPYQISEGLFLAQRLAEEKAPGVKTLYAAAARFNQTTDPLIQVYLAGFYRALKIPDTFGPMLEMLIRHSQQPQASMQSAPFNPIEEVGGTVLQQIAEHTAQEVLKRLPQRH